MSGFSAVVVCTACCWIFMAEFIVSIRRRMCDDAMGEGVRTPCRCHQRRVCSCARPETKTTTLRCDKESHMNIVEYMPTPNKTRNRHMTKQPCSARPWNHANAPKYVIAAIDLQCTKDMPWTLVGTDMRHNLFMIPQLTTWLCLLTVLHHYKKICEHTSTHASAIEWQPCCRLPIKQGT